MLLDLDAAERKLVYSELNPLQAGLTEPEEWPGLTSLKWRDGETIKSTRPNVFFCERRRPASLSIELSPLPEGFRDPESEEDVASAQVSAADRAESRSRVESLRKEASEAIHRELKKRKRPLAGPKKVRQIPHTTRGSHPLGQFQPRFATRDRELLAAAVKLRNKFLEKHEESRQRLVERHSDTFFPLGTYGYRMVLGVQLREDTAA